MQLKDIIKGTTLNAGIYGKEEIHKVTSDTRRIDGKSLFFAIPGYCESGENYINEALNKNAFVVSSEKNTDERVFKSSSVLKDFNKSLSNFYQTEDAIQVIGVTGTNGKTTTVFCIKHILDFAGVKNGIISTIFNSCGDEIEESVLTTPAAEDIHGLMKRMIDNDLKFVSMEVSSHAIDQKRTGNISFSAKVFTNATEDHLDYHKTKAAYHAVKRKFMEDGGGVKIINIDDPLGRKMAEEFSGDIFTYSLKSGADLTGTIKSVSDDGTWMEIEYAGFKNEVLMKHIFSDFMCENILGAMSVCLTEGISLEECLSAISFFKPPKGRMQRVIFRDNSIYIDYAHTPDALRRVLIKLKSVCKGRLIVVFGCGGDREREKRSIMGEISGEYADNIIVTSDNPRTEDPFSIANEIFAAVANENKEIIIDRYQAITKGLALLDSQDVLLIAGKGHEEYQIINDKRIHFSDISVVKELTNSMENH